MDTDSSFAINLQPLITLVATGIGVVSEPMTIALICGVQRGRNENPRPRGVFACVARILGKHLAMVL